MGWTFSHRDKGVTHRTYFTGEFPSTEIVDLAQGTPKELYMAVRSRDGSEVFAVVLLTQWNRADHFNFGYKDMSEDMEPYYYNCPKRILDALTLTTNEHSLRWRAKCMERLASVGERLKIGKGMIVEFSEPLRFRDGSARKQLRCIDARALRFTDVDLTALDDWEYRGQVYKIRRADLEGAVAVSG